MDSVGKQGHRVHFDMRVGRVRQHDRLLRAVDEMMVRHRPVTLEAGFRGHPRAVWVVRAKQKIR